MPVTKVERYSIVLHNVAGMDEALHLARAADVGFNVQILQGDAHRLRTVVLTTKDDVPITHALNQLAHVTALAEQVSVGEILNRAAASFKNPNLVLSRGFEVPPGTPED